MQLLSCCQCLVDFSCHISDFFHLNFSLTGAELFLSADTRLHAQPESDLRGKMSQFGLDDIMCILGDKRGVRLEECY